MRSRRWMAAGALTALVVALAGVSLGTLAGPQPARAAPLPAPLRQGVTVSGIVTTGSGTCFPDAVLMDCSGTVTHQLKGPGGAGFFTPYYNKWVSVNGAQQNCTTGDPYLQVVSVTPGQNPCGGGGQPTPPGPPGATATPVPTAGPTPLPGAAVNLTLGKPVKASSSQAGYPPENAVDGNPATFWASNAGFDPWATAQNVQWIYVDLGAPQHIESMRVLWGNQRHARTYGVYVWAERCRGWCYLGATSYGDGGEDMWYTRGTVEGQQFMLYLQNPYLRGQHYELLEWELFGTGTTPSTATNIAAGKPATAYNQAAGNESGKATDGDVNTEWRSQGGVPTWIYADLGTATEIDRAVLRWSAGAHATRYTAYAWDERYVPARWVAIYNQAAGTGGDETLTFWTIRTRYFLVYITGAAAAEVGLRELEVYNRVSSTVPNPPSPPGPPPLPRPFLFENDPARSGAMLSGRPRVTVPLPPVQRAVQPPAVVDGAARPGPLAVPAAPAVPSGPALPNPSTARD